MVVAASTAVDTAKVSAPLREDGSVQAEPLFS
jgi:hypothetical protein